MWLKILKFSGQTIRFNPWRGCTKVNAGCTNCYAEVNYSVKMHGIKWGTEEQGGTRRRLSDAGWKKPLKWNRQAAGVYPHGWPDGSRPRVFCGSLCDIFEDWQDGDILDHKGNVLHVSEDNRRLIIPPGSGQWSDQTRMTMDDLRDDLFNLIDATPNLDWLLLTKRPENIRRMWKLTPGIDPNNPTDDYEVAEQCLYRSNVWLGVSCSDQETADEAIPELLKCRDLAKYLFVSYEPALGPVYFAPYLAHNPDKAAFTLQESCHGHGNDGVRGGSQWGTRHRQRGSSVEAVCQEGQEARGDALGSVPSQESGASTTDRIPASSVDDRRGEVQRAGASSGVSGVLRSDTEGADDQSQGRSEKQQSSTESGSGDKIGELTARDSDSESRAVRGSGRGEESCGQIDRGTGDSNSGATEGGAHAGADSGRVWGSISDGEQNLQGPTVGLSWLIVGGESGPKARPCNIDWIRSAIDQCKAAGVACFVKQVGSRAYDSQQSSRHENRFQNIGVWNDGKFWPKLEHPKGGDPSEWPEDLRVREMPVIEKALEQFDG